MQANIYKAIKHIRINKAPAFDLINDKIFKDFHMSIKGKNK